MSADKKHYRLGPSSAKRWMACTASLLGPQEDTAGRAANYGTLIHLMFERAMDAMCSAAPHRLVYVDAGIAMRHVHQYLGTSLEGHPDVVFDEEAFAMVRWAVEQVVTLLLTYCPTAEILSEQQMVLAELTPVRGETLLGGTADLIIHDRDNLIVVDLKTGRTPVKADDAQLLLYALMASLIHRDAAPTLKIRTVVLQPNSTIPVQVHEVTAEELKQVWDAAWRVREELSRMQDATYMQFPGSATPVAGTHCQFCRRRGVCPAYQQTLFETSGEMIFLGPGKVELPAPAAEMPTERLLWFLERASLISGFLRDATKTLLRRAQAGETIPGRKLVASFGHRKWKGKKAPAAAANEMAAAWGLASAGAFTSLQLKSPAQVEKTLIALGFGSASDMVAEFAESPVTGVKLVDSKAPGDAILPEMVQVFLSQNSGEDEDE